MTIREMLEEEEYRSFSPYASFSRETKGRDRYEPPCDMRPAYQRDRDRILHSKSFRRLKHKTQVFLSPVDDHYRTRLTHTLEVSQIARTIAKALRLNEELAEAMALGHDLGHTPFGHAGEEVLNRICSEGFAHYKQSIRVVERLEKDGRGLNLTWEVRDGIMNHRTSGTPHTLEGNIVRLSDKIAYINHDVDDAIRAGILKEEMLPKDCTDVLGHSVRERLNCLIHSVITCSEGKPEILMAPDVERAMKDLRQFMFDHVYTNNDSKREEPKAKRLVEDLFYYYMDHTSQLPPEFLMLMEEGDSQERVVCDYIAGMTDTYAIEKFNELFVPKAWKI